MVKVEFVDKIDAYNIGGNYALESILKNVRGKLSTIGTSIRNLENNILSAIGNPNIRLETSGDSSQTENILNLAEIETSLAEYGGVKRELQGMETDILDALRHQYGDDRHNKEDNNLDLSIFDQLSSNNYEEDNL